MYYYLECFEYALTSKDIITTKMIDKISMNKLGDF
jgi:hypothetical protein